MKTRPLNSFLLALAFVFASAILYIPWWNNPLVFDDPNILKSTSLFDFAQNPFSIYPRNFPYFTLGFEHVMSNGNLHLSRIVNSVLHGLNGFFFFLLCQRFLSRIQPDKNALFTSLGIALIFVLHPVAVYGVGYLIQRTIVFATLFLLISAIQFDKALEELSWPRSVLAGVCFGLAVISKEHAVTGVISVLGLIQFHRSLNQPKSKLIILCFLASSLPFALWVVSIKLGLLGNAYEPDAHAIISSVGFPDAGSPFGNLLLSISLQSLFFFRYLGLWWWPDPSGMSIDIRPDFATLSTFPWIIVGPISFAALVGIMVYLLSSGKTNKSLRLVAYGLVWSSSLYLVELSTIKFQEPIVLYRSYLWAPGFLLAMAGLISSLSSRIIWPLITASLFIVAPLAWGRLDTFSDELKLWEEASLRLPSATIPGSIRIRYNLGIFRARANQIVAARKDFDWVIQQDPLAFHGYWGRSNLNLQTHAFTDAATDLQSVIKLKPDFGPAYTLLGFILKLMGDFQESEEMYSKAESLGQTRINFR